MVQENELATEQAAKSYSFWLIAAIPFALGTGLLHVLVVAIFGALFDVRKIWATVCGWKDICRAELIYLGLLVLFLLLYVFLNTASTLPPNGTLSKLYFFKVVGASLFMGVLPIMVRDPKACFWVLCAIAVGAFARGSASVLLSFYFDLPLPFYGAVFDVNTWAVGNSPSVANMLALTVTFFSALLASPRVIHLSKLTKAVCLMLVITATCLGACLQARLFFGIVFIVMPLLILLTRRKTAGYFYAGLVFLFCMILLGLSYELLHYGLGQRWSLTEFLADGRLIFYKLFIKQILINPWVHARLPEQFGMAQFHNFFADVQRISGTWAFIASLMLACYVLILLVILMKIGSTYGRFLLLIAIPCLIIMNLSVEPEGGGQIYLMFITVGSVAAVMAQTKQQKYCE